MLSASCNGSHTVRLTQSELKQCSDFALNSAKSQQAIEFGNYKTRPRSLKELARDTLIGKLGEVAFSRLLKEKFDVFVELDFKIYPQGIWDVDDFVLFGQRIDVKATRSGGRWLLVELNKLEFRQRENKLPYAFLFAITGWDRKTDYPTGIITLSGYAYLNQICHPEKIGLRDASICQGIKGTQFLKQNDLIPGTNTPLQADNCGRSVRLLEKNWCNLINLLKEASNADRKSF